MRSLLFVFFGAFIVALGFWGMDGDWHYGVLTAACFLGMVFSAVIEVAGKTGQR